MISNEEILSKVSFGYLNPRKIRGKYFCLYKTTLLTTGQVYVGVRCCSKDLEKDLYIGCGISSRSRKAVLNAKNFGYSKFREAFLTYGYDNFKRENLLFFKNERDAYRAESLIVTEDFVKDFRTLNKAIGGKKPPHYKGSDNGNYGNRWSENKKKKLRKYFRLNRNTKGSNNTRATPCVIIDLMDEEFSIVRLSYQRECDQYLGLKPGTVGTFLNREDIHIFKSRFTIIRETRFHTKPLSYWVDKAKKRFAFEKLRIFFEFIHSYNFDCNHRVINRLSKKYKVDVEKVKFYLNDCCKKYKKGDQGEIRGRISP